MTKLILDTDIGTDVDDLMALALILASPEIELLGVTTAYGDTALRGKIVHRVLALAGRDVPITAGPQDTYLPGRPIFWPGHEGKNAGIEDVPDSVLSVGSAPDFILETIRANPDEVVLCAVAPLTNLAHALEKGPETMRQLKAVYMMGGVFGADNPNLELPTAEHNIRCDPEAARVVFDSGLPIRLFPLDVTLKVPLAQADVDEIARSGTSLAAFLGAELTTWLEFIGAKHGRDHTHMHDPLTVAALLEPAIVTHSVKTRLRVECAGELTLGATVPDSRASQKNVEVALQVDAARFHKLFMNRLLTLSAPTGTPA